MIVTVTEYQKFFNALSRYSGVSWSSKYQKWIARLYVEQKQIYGGIFDNEIDAAKRVNGICDGLNIPHKNPGIGTLNKNEAKVVTKINYVKNSI